MNTKEVNFKVNLMSDICSYVDENEILSNHFSKKKSKCPKIRSVSWSFKFLKS